MQSKMNSSNGNSSSSKRKTTRRGINQGNLRTVGLCPYGKIRGVCYATEDCLFFHGMTCTNCGNATLHPFSPEQNIQHEQECKENKHLKELYLQSYERSKDMTCGICFEKIMKKGLEMHRFAISPYCKHCFCFSCLTRWRQSKYTGCNTSRCPSCRKFTPFVIPSKFWIEDEAEKESLFEDYKQVVGKLRCKYYTKRREACPSNSTCFFLHEENDQSE